MTKLLNKIKTWYRNWKWQPDYSNPDHIRYLVVRDCRMDLTHVFLGYILAFAGVIEMATIMAGAPAVLSMFEKNIVAGDLHDVEVLWMFRLAILNGTMLSLYVVWKGLQLIGKEDDFAKLLESKNVSEQR